MDYKNRARITSKFIRVVFSAGFDLRLESNVKSEWRVVTTRGETEQLSRPFVDAESWADADWAQLRDVPEEVFSAAAR